MARAGRTDWQLQLAQAHRDLKASVAWPLPAHHCQGWRNGPRRRGEVDPA